MSKLKYCGPCLRVLKIEVPGIFCDSYGSKSIPDYNKRSDINIEWDED